MYVDDESFIDMATSISGSGPAYVFFMMESMIDAGVHMGFPRTYNQKELENRMTLRFSNCAPSHLTVSNFSLSLFVL